MRSRRRRALHAQLPNNTPPSNSIFCGGCVAWRILFGGWARDVSTRRASNSKTKAAKPFDHLWVLRGLAGFVWGPAARRVARPAQKPKPPSHSILYILLCGLAGLVLELGASKLRRDPKSKFEIATDPQWCTSSSSTPTLNDRAPLPCTLSRLFRECFLLRSMQRTWASA